MLWTDRMREPWNEALHLMETALTMLDGSDAPAEVGARLDMAICSLKDAIQAKRLAPSKTRQVTRSNHS